MISDLLDVAIRHTWNAGYVLAFCVSVFYCYRRRFDIKTEDISKIVIASQGIIGGVLICIKVLLAFDWIENFHERTCLSIGAILATSFSVQTVKTLLRPKKVRVLRTRQQLPL